MLASTMRHRIKFLEITIDLDEMMQEIEVETMHIELWCAIFTLKGEDIQSAGTEYQKNSFRFVTRYVPSITSKMIIEFQGQRYSIDEMVNDNMRNETLTIIARNKLGV